MLQIITSSPIKSNPSTEMIDILLRNTADITPGLITGTIIVFDGYNYAEKEEWKQSRINQTSINNYNLFKLLIKQRLGREIDQKSKRQQIGTNSFSNLITRYYENNFIVIEHDTRVGFALALYSGLEIVNTPLVLVNQHDWVLVENVPLKEILDIMNCNSQINYVGFVSRRSTNYHLKFNQEIVEIKNLPFCKLYFWFDRIHIARTDFYKSVVFNNNRFQRGNFIEDTFGHVMMDDCKNGNWEKYNAYLYYPNTGQQVSCRHLNGRMYLLEKDRKDLKNRFKKESN